MNFSKHELEIMTVLWKVGSDLSRTEIIAASQGQSWKPSTIHILLNSLMKKGAVVVVGMRQSGKIYGRTYATAMTKEVYLASQMKSTMQTMNPQTISIPEVFSALLDRKEVTSDTIKELRAILDDWAAASGEK